MASVVDLKSKEEKDAELDRKIEALRKKNEALVRRHQLIEEDRKRAEQEGIAVTAPRKAKTPDGEPEKARKERENFSIILDVSAGQEKRIVNDKSPKGPTTPPRTETSPRSPTHRTSGRTGIFSGGRGPHVERPVESTKADGDHVYSAERPARGRRIQGEDGSRRGPHVPTEGPPGDQWGSTPRRGRGRGQGRGGGALDRGGENTEGGPGPDRRVKEWEEKRKLNIEKMNEEMEKIAEYERSQRDGMREKNPIRNFLDDPRRTGPIADVDRKEGSRRHIRNWGGSDFEKVKTGMDREKESHVRRPGAKNQMDMTMSMTGRERAEYMRWKQERERIDQERLARHKKPTGQWRREWDAEKSDSMFKDGSAPPADEEPMGRREGKRGAPKPPTMAEFLPESLKRSTQRRDQKRGRGRSKPYSMHDSRWEEDEDEDEEEVHEKQEAETLKRKEENETPGEKAAEPEQTAEAPQKKVPEEPAVDPEQADAKNDEAEEEDCEGEEEEDCEGEDDEEWTDASGDDYVSEGEEHPGDEVTKDSASPPKERRLPQRAETPKLTLPPPSASSEEGALESKPTSPFSPDGHRPVTDWGEEMELLSPPGSSNEDSPPQAVNKKVFNMDSGPRSDGAQNPSEEPEGGAMPSEQSISQHPTGIPTDQPQKPTEETLPDGRETNQGAKPEETQEAPTQPVSAVEEPSPVRDPTPPVTAESAPVTEESSAGAAEQNAAVTAVRIADYETHSTETPPSS